VQREAVFPLTGKVTENPQWLQRVWCAGLITLFAAAVHAKRCRQLSPLRLAIFLGFTQLLAALLVNQTGDLWYTSYSGLQRLHTGVIVALGAVLGGLTVRRALDVLSGQSSGALPGLWMRYLFLAFVALAIYKSLGLALNGRYLSIPYPLTGIAVAGILGLTAIRYFTGRRGLAHALEFTGLTGAAPVSRKRDWMLSCTLGFAGLALIAAETRIFMTGLEFIAAYPQLGDRLWGAFMTTVTRSQLLGWALLAGAVVFVLPLKASGYALGLMGVAVIYGETHAFTVGHDFIVAHPQFGERTWAAFVYTAGNRQLLLWLGSLGVLALPLLVRTENR
jgi:hypothetical protein